MDPQPPTPFPNPFILSSVERDWAGEDADRIVMLKRRHLEANLSVIAGELGMDAEAQASFLDWWCSPEVGHPREIRAESDKFFNLRQRAGNWVSKRNPAPQTSRIQKAAETTVKFNNILDQIYGNSDTVN